MTGPLEQVRPGDRGFTLMELLVALALVGLIAVVLTGGLRFGARVWEASRDGAEAVGEVTAIRGFVRERAMAVRPVRLPRDGNGTAPGTFFGTATSVQFVTQMPSYVSRGGLYHLAIGEEAGGGLRLAWWPVGAARGGPGSGNRRLLNGARGLELSYYGAPDPREAMAWRADWPEGPGLPRLISIKVGFPEGDLRNWPELIVSLPAALRGLAGRRTPSRAPVP